jgi:predicted membrane-bound mannosyltransferase
MDASLSSPTAERRIDASSVDALVLGAILVLAACLRFYAIDHSSLWSDEGNTWALVQRSFGEIAQSAAADIHPPGYYWLLKGWSALFGTSAADLRSFSAVCGILVVYLTWLIARQIAPTPTTSRMVAATSALVAAVLPFQIYYSQEARMYMLLALEAAILFLIVVVWRAAEITGARQRAWTLTAAVAVRWVGRLPGASGAAVSRHRSDGA